MEIDQYLYDLNDAGDAIVAYRMTAANGGYVEVCNLGASVLSWSLPSGDGGVRDITSGRIARGLRALQGDDNFGGVRFGDMLWEGRVEVNRVVMSLSFESEGVGIISEVVFDYDDDNTLEITYIYCVDADYQFDLTHSLTLQIDGDVECDGGDRLKMVEGHRRSILGYVGRSGDIEIYSSQPAMYMSGDTMALVDPMPQREAEVRCVSKSVYKVIG